MGPWPPSFLDRAAPCRPAGSRSEEHTSELQSPCNIVCRLLLEKKTNVSSDVTELTQILNFNGNRDMYIGLARITVFGVFAALRRAIHLLKVINVSIIILCICDL